MDRISSTEESSQTTEILATLSAALDAIFASAKAHGMSETVTMTAIQALQSAARQDR